MTHSRASQIAALKADIAHLTESLAGFARMPALQAQIRAELVAKQAEFDALLGAAGGRAQTGGVDMGSAQIERMDGDIVGGDKHVHYGEAGVSAGALLRTYLSGVIGAANALTLTEADESDRDGGDELRLEDVYTRLEVASGFPMARAAEPGAVRVSAAAQRQATALEALTHHGRMVLLGPPGSGKSTLTRFLSLCLARAAAGDAAWLARLGEGWAAGPPIPVRVELSLFAEWLGSQAPDASPASLLWEYLGVRERRPSLGALLSERAHQGAIALILDGLDEVPHGESGALLRRVREMIGALAALPEPRVIIVTCRVLDYDEAARRIPGWPTETLIPFSDDLQQEFIGRWFATLRRLGREVIGDYDALTEKLRRAVRERDDMRRLAGNPLLLTMMAVLHGSKGELPDSRVKLYRECLDLLLRRWRRSTGRPAIEEHMGVAGWGRGDTDRLLNQLGFVAHDQEPAGDDDVREGGAILTEEALVRTTAQVLRRFFAGQSPPASDADPYGPAGRFRIYVSQHSNGVLQCHGLDAYRFPHRTFQEFLAARCLIEDRGWPKEEQSLVGRLAARALAAQWHEVLLLAVSLIVERGTTPEVATLVRRLLTMERRGTRAWAQAAVVAAELLVEAGRANLQAVWEDALWDEAASVLVSLLRPPVPGKTARTLLDAAWRVRAGAALGRLGDSRPGVCDLRIDWCDVPGGSFLMGSAEGDADAADDEKPQRTVELPGFRISRYPVTNAQWRVFVEAGGYAERRWWSEAGWQAKKQKGWTMPEDWDEPRFSGPNQPVVGVSWYEATAFCRWLSAELGYEVRLPSEAEWEKAARGRDGRIYPWGNAWDPERANTDEGGAGATSPVGCYPNGTSPCGALDMIGNVWEWTATPWTSDYQESDGAVQEAEDGTSFVRRGGAWSFVQWYARCAYRNINRPSLRLDLLGVRVVAALTLS